MASMYASSALRKSPSSRRSPYLPTHWRCFSTGPISRKPRFWLEENTLRSPSFSSRFHVRLSAASRFWTFLTPPRRSSLAGNGADGTPLTTRLGRRGFSGQAAEAEGASVNPESKLPVTKFTEDQLVLRDSVRRFAEEEIQPLVSKMDEQAKLDEGILSSLFQQGYMGIEVPLSYGGSGMSFTDCLIVIEEIARVDPSVAILVDIHNTLINRCIAAYGTEEQKQTYLPKCAQESVGSFCISESGSGSDAFALQARAVKAEGGWTLTGAKQWISNSVEAGVFLVFATVDPQLKYKGITAFIVDKDSPGLEVGAKYDKLGIRASSTCEVILNDVFVPHSRVLGDIGKGYKVAIEGLNEGRIGIAAQMLGLAEGAFHASMQYVNQRKQFGSLIADFQGVRHQFAQMAASIEAARCLVYNAAALKEAGYVFTKEAAIAKLFCGQIAEEVASKSVELFGGYGFTKEYPVEKFYRDAKIGSIYEGTSNIQLDTIAKQIQTHYRSR